MLEGLTPPVKERLCIIGKQAAELDSKDLTILMDALANPRWSSEALALALTERGFKVSDSVLRKHRRKECACAR